MGAEVVKFEPLWTIEDVSAFLAIPVHTLYQWRTRRTGPPARRVGKHLRYRPEDVRTWFDELDQEVA
jgi:hypothetical protein